VTRAAALPADERRAAIVAATVPLLLEGGTVTTRHIADAAGIAEGTIFRVFADKDEVLRAAVDAVLDPAPTEALLRAIDPTLPIDEVVTLAAATIQGRLAAIWRVVDAAGINLDAPRRPPDLVALTALLSHHRAVLRDDPASAARKLRALTLACSHPALADEPLEPAEIASLFLDGLRARPSSEESPCSPT
jgi:AcrR family transcriptional regulator